MSAWLMDLAGARRGGLARVPDGVRGHVEPGDGEQSFFDMATASGTFERAGGQLGPRRVDSGVESSAFDRNLACR